MRRSDRFWFWLLPGLAICLLCSLANAAATLEIIPASPRYQEPVYARFNLGLYSCTYGAQVAMSGTSITITPNVQIDLCGWPYDVELGRFPTGNYTVQLGTVVAQFTVGPPMPQTSYAGTVPAVNYSGMWWNASESGWGLSISQGPTNQLFAVWFVYNAAGAPTWYTLESGRWESTNVQTQYAGRVYRYTGPYYPIAFDPNKVVGTAVGTGTLTFSSANAGRLEYTIEGTSGFKAMTRLPIE
jgi:hypothetical protein